MQLREVAIFLGYGCVLLAVGVAVILAPRACEIVAGVVLLLAAVRAGAKAVRGRRTAEPGWWRFAWVAALFGITGVVLFVWGFITAVLFALAFVGASTLAFTAFILNLLLGEEPLPLRILLIALFCGGLVVEVGGLARTLGLTLVIR
jgi:hypothetical protein